MGIFSKIFGATTDGEKSPDEPSVEVTIEPEVERPTLARNEPAARPAEAKSGEKRTGTGTVVVNPPLGQTVRGAPNTSAQGAPPNGAADRPPATRRGPRPSVPPAVDAQLFAQSAKGPAGGTAHKKAQDPAPTDPGAAAKERRATSGAPPSKKGNTQPGGTAVALSKTAPVQVVKTERTTPVAEPAGKKGSARISVAPTLSVGAAPKPVPAAAPAAAAAKTAEAQALELDPIEPHAAPRAPLPSESDDIDKAFNHIVAPAHAAGPGKLAEDRATKEANTKLFRDIAVDHAKPLREFMLDLSVGTTTKQWLDVVRPAAKSLLTGARELGETDIAAALDGLMASVERIGSATGTRIADADRQALLREYETLARVLPGAFDVKADRARREPILVRHLLMQVSGMHKVGIDKLFAAGLSSLDALCRSSIDDLTSLARLDPDTAAAVVQRFRSYLKERTEQTPGKLAELAKEKLRALIARLERAHAEFLDAEDSEDKARKRKARAERTAHCLEMNIVLAQLGEVDLVAELERSATEQRIQRVRNFIEHSVSHH